MHHVNSIDFHDQELISLYPYTSTTIIYISTLTWFVNENDDVFIEQ